MNPRIAGRFAKPSSLKKGNEKCPFCNSSRHIRIRSRTRDIICYKCKKVIRKIPLF